MGRPYDQELDEQEPVEPEVDPAPTVRDGEAARVFEWRVEVLMDLEFDADAARRLAESEVDLHEVARWVRAGCPHELAEAIVR